MWTVCGVDLLVIKHGYKKMRISFPGNDVHVAVGAWCYRSPSRCVTRNPTVYRLSNNYFSSKGNEGGSRR